MAKMYDKMFLKNENNKKYEQIIIVKKSNRN